MPLLPARSAAAVVIALLAAAADGFGVSACSRPACAAHAPWGRWAPERLAAVRLLTEEPGVEGEAEPAADSEAAAPTGAPAEAEEEEEEEEEEDLLSTPAFLKQKLKVLEKEEAEVLAKTEEMKAEGSAIGEEWVQKRTRLQTDFDNFKARNANQTLEAQLEARIKLLQEFLPVLDNFDRARNSISPDGEAQEAANAQYQEMHAELMGALSGLGMQKIECVGQEFDYNLHMAIQQVPSDEYDEGVVCTEMQPGYTCKDSLVRAAYVMVSSGPM